MNDQERPAWWRFRGFILLLLFLGLYVAIEFNYVVVRAGSLLIGGWAVWLAKRESTPHEVAEAEVWENRISKVSKPIYWVLGVLLAVSLARQLFGF